MAKPPPSPPSSDIEGLHRDRPKAGQPAGESAQEEEKARSGSRGRPADSKR